jgi:hypothetical protein
MLWSIFGPKSEEVAGGCRRLHNEELHNLYASPSVFKSDKVTEDEMSGTYSTDERVKKRILCFGWKGKRPLRRRRRGLEIILECILGKYDGTLWTGFIWLRIGTSGGPL